MIDVRIDTDADEPPFEQLRRQVAQAVAEGHLQPGASLPTVRALAADLGLAANTVARAYRELESAGVVETQGRRGTFVASQALGTADVRADAEQAATTFVDAARRLGLSREESVRLVQERWGR